MVVLNEMSRYHLVLEALRRLRLSEPKASALTALCHTMLERHHRYVRAQLEDLPEIRDWVWPF